MRVHLNIYTLYRDVTVPDDRSPGRLNFVSWRLKVLRFPECSLQSVIFVASRILKCCLDFSKIGSLMCVCIYIYTHTHTYIYIYIHTHIYVHANIYMLQRLASRQRFDNVNTGVFETALHEDDNVK
jgi:hypothetical protein